MKAMKQIVKMLVATALVAAAGSGCVAPQPKRSVQWIAPVPDGYYTGEKHDFANRFNPDPKGRKFRVAFMDIRLKEVNDIVGAEGFKRTAQKTMDVFMGDYLTFREQGKDSHQRKYYEENPELMAAALSSMKSGFSYAQTHIAFFLAGADVVAAGGWNRNGGALGEPEAREFMRHREDAGYINAELARRYPGLFTAEESGFPLEVAMIGLVTTSDPVVRTRFEAWLVGLPEHATRTGWGAFMPEEVHLSPYDAIAAAMFKLTDEQFEGLEPANPKDHEWVLGRQP